MWLARREEGFDDPRPTKRAPFLNLNDLVGVCFRLGFSLQLFSLTCLYLTFWFGGGFGLFRYDLQGLSEEEKEPQGFRNCLTVFSGLYMLGSFYIMAFQIFLADDCCWARGFRAGSKILRLASFLDVLSSLFQFMFYFYISKFYTDKWYVHFMEGGSEWVFFTFTRMIHAIAFILYAGSTYLLEVYHDEGAGDLHAYINGSIFFFAGLAEIICIFLRWNSVSTLLIWVALVCVTVWAYFFEPEVNDASPALYETELTNDVEQQVELFASSSPYRLQEDNMILENLKKQIQMQQSSENE